MTFISLFTSLFVFASFEQEKKLWAEAGFENVEVSQLHFQVRTRFRTPLQIVLTPDLALSREKLERMLLELNNVYKQCQLTFTPITLTTTDPFKGIEYWNKFDSDAENSLEFFRSSMPLPQNTITAVFIKGYSDAEKISGFSFADWSNGVGLRPPLYNSVWISDYAESPEYLEFNNFRYSLLAHELLHVLTYEGQHIAPSYLSLMSISRFRTNRILPENCELVRNHPLVESAVE